MTREAITYFEGQKKRLEDFRKIYPSPDTVGYKATTKEISFYDMAISALSENVRPNIHGHWKAVSDGYGDNAYICECSECKDTVWVYKGADRKWNYCPNCGADMRGSTNE